MRTEYIVLSKELDSAGLVWYPEIGDEVAQRPTLDRVSILVDPQGLTPTELRSSFLWLPTVEQLVQQFEAREALIYHAGVTDSMKYQVTVRAQSGVVEVHECTLRLAFARALQELLQNGATTTVH